MASNHFFPNYAELCAPLIRNVTGRAEKVEGIISTTLRPSLVHREIHSEGTTYSHGIC